MTTRCNPLARASALLVLILALFAIPSATRAQDACRCDFTTIAVDANVNCRVTICYQLSPSGPTICTVIAPGSRGRIPCPVYQASIITCNGSYIIIGGGPVISICTPVLHLAPDCCVRACRGTDAAGCSLITVSATPCPSDNCP
jgi:hypothetical protein